jgi:hypothetical protein
MTSQALADFRDGLQLAKELLNIEATYPALPNATQRRPVEALRGGAVVLMVGAWESFLRDMVPEHFQSLTQATSGTHRSTLPEEIQVTAVWNALELALSGPLHEASTKKSRLPEVLRVSRVMAADDIEPRALARMQANPKAQIVAGLFRSVGIPDIWRAVVPAFTAKWGTAVPDLPQLLDDVVQKRHLAAHSPRLLSVARKDIQDHVRFLEVLAEVLDDHLAAYCAALQSQEQATSAAKAASPVGTGP